MNTITNPTTERRPVDAVTAALENLSLEFVFSVVDHCDDRSCAVCHDERLELAA